MRRVSSTRRAVERSHEKVWLLHGGTRAVACFGASRCRLVESSAAAEMAGLLLECCPVPGHVRLCQVPGSVNCWVPGFAGQLRGSGTDESLQVLETESCWVQGLSGDAREGIDTPGRREPKELRGIEPRRMSQLRLHHIMGRRRRTHSVQPHVGSPSFLHHCWRQTLPLRGFC